MDEEILVIIKLLVLSFVLSIAIGQCPVGFDCPVGQICAMARQDYGPARPECINSGGEEAALLHQAMGGRPASPYTRTDHFGFNRYRGSRYHSGYFGRPYLGFRDPYVRDNWNLRTGRSRYPIGITRYPSVFGRPVQTFGGGYVPTVLPAFHVNKFGPSPSVVNDMTGLKRHNVTVDNNNKNVLTQNGSGNVDVNQVATQSATPTPPVDPMHPIHPGPLVPVNIHDVLGPGIHPKITHPEVDLPVEPVAGHGNQGIPLGFVEPVDGHGNQGIPLGFVEPVDGHGNQGMPLGFVEPVAGNGNQGIPLGFAKPRVV